MFDLSWTEIALLVVVALIFIGPKDLPIAMRTLSRGIKAVRRMANEFQQHLDEMVREADLSEARDQLREIRQFDLRGQVRRMIDPEPEAAQNSLVEERLPQDSLPRAPAPPEPPAFEYGKEEELPYNARMKARLEALEKAPMLLPPATALRLIEEFPHCKRPSVLPPEISLHQGRRVPIITDAPAEVPRESAAMVAEQTEDKA
ncbi:twin-arginine translocase subunit TatB [Saccharibacter sp. 17.LH.SD]|uniref:Sec-independent protein translocase protein TatB n=1 Tax=Saccharibacter sp. 17.LH.SD TaxID=2689393 RepID=UPI00136E54B6|nr:Sec-independent protein translocase protein TatB [Saccharibacter sp. 17.LH.SD]MXV44043.1 twin-arginine translocase subunit TatB [Saccharibacter sp. 17.LH.SD]